MRAGLERRVEAVRGLLGDECHGVGKARVEDVETDVGCRGHLEAESDRGGLRDGRTGAVVVDGGGAAGRFRCGDEGRDDLTVLRMHAHPDPPGGHHGEGLEEFVRGDAREPHRIGLEERDLEAADALVDHAVDVVHAVARSDGAVERDVDARLGPDAIALADDRGSSVDGVPRVVGHVDDRRHTSGRRGGRGAVEGLGRLGERVDVGVDSPGQHQQAGAAQHARRSRDGGRSGVALEHGRDAAVLDHDGAVVDHAIRSDDAAADDTRPAGAAGHRTPPMTSSTRSRTEPRTTIA
ncbi:hypothetical protein QE430_000239 [Microbacterium testaceum]|nr:hypothetical protein [Microbacterium testaceum]MDQ1171932.1 hypothetical protein [Microbacterium testaceum]